MSTKIYNGIKFQNTNLETIIKKIKKFKHTFEKYSNDIVYNALSENYFNFLDGIHGRNDNNCYLQLREEFEKELENLKKGYRSVDYDNSFSVSLKEHGNSVYGYLFYEHSEFKNMFFKLLKVKDYSYWNNSDRPENISKKNWKKRKNIWDKLLTSYSFEKSNFITIKIAELNEDAFDKFQFENLNIKDYEKRLKKFTERTAISIILDKIIKEKEGHKFDTSWFFKALKEYKNGDYEELNEKIKLYFSLNHKRATKDNFKTVIPLNTKEIIENARIK